MTNWKATINLSGIWNERDWNSDNAHILGEKVSRILEKYSKGKETDYELSDIIERFASVNTLEFWNELCSDDDLWENIPPIDEFDGIMSDLYDWADVNQVWIKTNF